MAKSPPTVCCVNCDERVRVRDAYLGFDNRPYCSLRCLMGLVPGDTACSTSESIANVYGPTTKDPYTPPCSRLRYH